MVVERVGDRFNVVEMDALVKGMRGATWGLAVEWNGMKNAG